MKALHIADIQYNVRQGHLRRFVEYEHINKQLIDKAKSVEFVFIVGDVFEHWNSNSLEESLFVKLLKGMLEVNDKLQIVITAGNHDLKQRDNTFDAGDGSQMQWTDSIDKLVTAIDDKRIKYINNSRVELLAPGFAAAVWAQNEKWSGGTYSPWASLDESQIAALSSMCVIELFHDPVKNCVNFDDCIVRGDNDSRIDATQFHSNFVAMGDIHKHAIWVAGDKTLTYCGSPIVRDFGEGDYLLNDTATQQGTAEHGYNLLDIDIDNKRIAVEWHPLEQLVHYHTITIDNDVKTDKIALINPGRINKIKIKSKVTKPELSGIVERIAQNLVSSYVVAAIDILYDSAVIDSINAVDANGDNLLQKVQTAEWLKDAALDWVNAYIERNAIVATEDAQQFVDMFKSLIDEQIDKLSFDTEVAKYVIQNVKANQFMALKDVDVNFDNLAQLTQVRGNNGNGKTTIFRLIKWLLTGFIDAGQSSAATKQNALTYFNDKLIDNESYDKLEASCVFVHVVAGQNVHYKLTRTLERKFKRGSRINADGSWRDNVSAVNETVQLVRLSDDYVVPQHEIKDTIYAIFGSIWELSRYVCINQTLLDQIIAMDSNSLNDWLLDTLGINTFVQLGNSNDAAKAALFDGLSKPALTDVAIKAELESLNTTCNELNDSLQLRQDNQKEWSTKLTKARAKVEELSKRLHQIPADILTVEDATANIDNIIAKIRKVELDIAALALQDMSKLQTAKAQIEQQLTNIDNEANAAYTNVIASGSQLHNTYAELLTKQNELSAKVQKEVAHAESLYRTKLDESKLAYDAAKQHIDSVLVNLGKSYNAATQAKIDALQKQIEDINTVQNALRTEISAAKTNIDNVIDKQKQLENDKCPVCTNDLTSGTGQAYKLWLSTELAKLRQEYGQKTEQFNENVVKIGNLKHEIEQLQAAIIDVTDSNAIIAALNPAHKAAYDMHAEKLNDLQRTVVNAQRDLDAFIAQPMATAATLLEVEAAKMQIADITNQLADIKRKAEQAKQDVLQSKSAVESELTAVNAELKIAQAEYDKKAAYESTLKQLEIDKTAAAFALEHAQQTQQYIAANAALKVDIDDAKQHETEANSKLLSINADIATMQADLSANNVRIEALKKDLQASKKWSIANLVYNAYKQCTSKRGLVSYVFAAIATSLNAQLNDLLDSLNYRVFFDINDNNVLKMIDLMGSKSIRSVSQMSGMEGTFAGLAIVHLILTQRLNKVGNILLIDEISGKLSNGQIVGAEHDVNNINYQQVLMQLLTKLSAIRKTLIVDHVLQQDEFDSALTVVANTDGTSSIC